MEVNFFILFCAGFQKSNFKVARKPYRNENDSRLKWLEENFVKYLVQWRNSVAECPPLFGDVDRKKMLLSQSTEQGLIISSLAISSLVKVVLQAGAEYVLARRINQDPLEAYFGQQRRKGWRSDAPTVSLFGNNARNIDICKELIGSNVILE